MPAKNVIKFYLSNSSYHIYNRGVEKRKIFIDDQDYKVFLTYLKDYLSNPLQGPTLSRARARGLYGKYYEQIKLLSFCLMPNHVHLLIKQQDKNSIKKFTQSLFTRYSMYFNKRYKRSGPLFQGKYKATNVITDELLLDISRYIHKNPIKITDKLTSAYSSYSCYLGEKSLEWLDTNLINKLFINSKFMAKNNIVDYKYFVEKFLYQSEIDRFSSVAGSDPATELIRLDS